MKRPRNRNVVDAKWIFKKKIDSEGNICKYKARWVARGFSQKPGKDFFETYSPVVKKTTLRTLFAISTLKQWEKRDIDVDAAYLNSKIKEEVYVEQPEVFELQDPRDYVFKLKRSLYGLHQSGKNWNE